SSVGPGECEFRAGEGLTVLVDLLPAQCTGDLLIDDLAGDDRVRVDCLSQFETVCDVLRADFTPVCGADCVRPRLRLQPVPLLLFFRGLHPLGRGLELEAHRSVSIGGLLNSIDRVRRRNRPALTSIYVGVFAVLAGAWIDQ